MGATSSAAAQGDYENPEVGNYPARCIQVVELGTHHSTYNEKPTTKEELLIVFELDELMEDGKPFVVSWWGTNSLAETSNLFKLLQKWRGVPFTPAELERFDLGNILDKCCSVDVVKTKKGGVTVDKTGVSSMNKRLTMPPRVNELVNFGISDLGTEEWDKLYPWVQKVIERSDEGKEFFGQNPPSAGKAEDPPAEVLDDDIPF